MPEYGVVPTGIQIKRLDVILGELHDELSRGWGVDTRLNPKSYLSVQLTAFADKIAELWEFGEQVYNSMYPFSAEDTSLDNAVQYGGVSREDARPTIYPVHCECKDGITIPKGTLIRTNTNPAVQFVTEADTLMTRGAFNRAAVEIAALQPTAIYTIALNGELYSYTSQPSDTRADVLNGVASSISTPDFTVSVDNDNNLLSIAAADTNSINVMILSGNLTTQSVTGIVRFSSETKGDVVLPDGVINQIVTAVPGLISVNNILPRIAGRLRQTDIALRQSYADKIFNLSSRMLESIRSAILQKVQGVTSVAGYQNDTNIVDTEGRWPHSVEMVVDGGDDAEIAAQIWDKKAGGIQTYGSTEVTIKGNEGEPVIIRFNRPEYVYIWFRVTITLNPSETLPPNYIDAINAVVINAMSKTEPGKSIIPQRLIDAAIYAAVPGIAYIETETFYTSDINAIPDNYVSGVVPITPRQRAVTDETRIEVVLSG